MRRFIVMLQDKGIPDEAERGPYGAYQLPSWLQAAAAEVHRRRSVALRWSCRRSENSAYSQPAAVEGAQGKRARHAEKLLRQFGLA